VPAYVAAGHSRRGSLRVSDSADAGGSRRSYKSERTEGEPREKEREGERERDRITSSTREGERESARASEREKFIDNQIDS